MAFGLLVLVALPRLAYIASVATIGLLVVGGLFIGGLAVTGVRLPLGTGLTAAAGGALALGYVAIAGTVDLGHQACVRGVGVSGRRCAPGERSRAHRAQPDRAAAHRHRADRALQLPLRQAPRAARSSCAWRTPTSPARPWLRARHPRRPALAGHRLGRGSGGCRQPARGPYGPYRQMQRLDHYRAAADQVARARTRPTTAIARREELAADRAGPGGGAAAAALRRSVRPSLRGDRAAARSRGPQAGHPFPRGRRASSRSTTSSAATSRSTPRRWAATSIIVRSDGTPLYHFTVRRR